MRIYRDEDEKEKEEGEGISFFFSSSNTKFNHRNRREVEMALPDSWSGQATIRTLQQMLSPWRRAPSADAYADRVQVAEEWAKLVHGRTWRQRTTPKHRNTTINPWAACGCATDSGPDALTTTTATDNAEASAEVGLEEEATDGAAGADGSIDTLATADGGGSSSSSSSIYIKTTQQSSITAIDN